MGLFDSLLGKKKKDSAPVAVRDTLFGDMPLPKQLRIYLVTLAIAFILVVSSLWLDSRTLSQNARLFALVGMAMGDAGIVAWDGPVVGPYGRLQIVRTIELGLAWRWPYPALIDARRSRRCGAQHRCRSNARRRLKK